MRLSTMVWLGLQVYLIAMAVYSRSWIFFMFVFVILILGLSREKFNIDTDVKLSCKHNSTYRSVNGECICSVCGKKVGGG